MPVDIQPEDKVLTLHPAQAKAYKSTKQFIGVITGAQAGKTTFGAVWFMREIKRHPYDNHMIVANSYKVLTSATQRVFEEWAPQGAFKWYGAQDKAYYKIDQRAFGLPYDPDKGFVYVRSAESPNKIVGFTLRSVWFDEAGESSKLAWLNIQNRVEILNGRVLLTSTPYSFNWLKEFVDMAQAGEPTYDYINFPTSDNPRANKQSIAAKKRTMVKEDFERLYLGLFTRPESIVYQAFDADKMIVSPEEYDLLFKEDPVKETIVGVDWGWNDPTVMLVINIHQSGTFVVADEYFKTKQSLDSIVEAAKGIRMLYKKTRYFYADSAYPQHIAQFNATKTKDGDFLRTIAVTKRPQSKSMTYIEEGISHVQELMFDGKFYCLSSCRETIREFGSYRWKRRTNLIGQQESINAPEDFDNHAMDALRYAVDSHWIKRTRPEEQPAPTGGILEQYLNSLKSGKGVKNKDYSSAYTQFSQDGRG